MDFQLHRPHGYRGKADKHLKDAIRALKYTLIKARRSLTYNTLRLSDKEFENLAAVLVEFAEDIHNDIGIWKSYEQYNLEYFNTTLPVILKPNESKEDKELLKYRVWHLMWVLCTEFNPDIILKPTHKDLLILVELISDFLQRQFSKIPKYSTIKKFLSQPNQYGWDVKRKLVWLGRHSYLFRYNFNNYYVDTQYNGKIDIPIIDDFICQQNTCWSGLGVIDILAATLNISEQQRADLRSWYERHLAAYKILAIKGPIMEAMNIVNEKPYIIRAGEHSRQFRAQQLVVGSLVPWNNEWYWSGNQSVYKDTNEKVIQELKNHFLQKPKIAYRYCKQLAQRARESMEKYYNEFVKYHGDDLVSYPDGLSMTADLQKIYRLRYESQPKEVVLDIMKKHNLSHPWPNITFPKDLIESENGVGVYLNPDEGLEIMVEFNSFINGLKKKGINLDEDEVEAIQGFIFSDKISPKVIKKIVQKYVDESIASVFYIDKSNCKYFLDYLLRRYKGHYYRNRYPGISFV
ncbi:MAG: DUF3843 family protein [bacterium]